MLNLNYAKTLLRRLGLNNLGGSIALLLVATALLYFVMNKTALLQFGGGQNAVTNSGGGGTSVKKLVLYYAPWCGHCQKLKPTWAQLESSYDGKVLGGQTIKIEKVNGDDDKETVQALNINGFPTIVLYKDDGDKLMYNGDRSFKDLVTFLNTN